MKTRIYDKDFSELLVEADYPLSFDSEPQEVCERTYRCEEFLGNGVYHEIFFEGIHIGHGNIALAGPILMHFDSEFETVEMHFALSGNTLTKSRAFKNEMVFGTNQHNLVYADGFQGSSEWSADLNMEIFEVNLQPAFFQKYLPKGPIFDLFSECISRKESASLSEHNYPITPNMLKIIREIIGCNRTGIFKRMFLESSVLELLMLQLEQITHHKCEVFCSTQKQHLEKLYAAKEILTNELDGNFTLNSLAQQVGTNEFTLKKGFRELFGTTVFGYWNEVKMEQAQNMLLEEQLSVAEIADKVGYKNPQHFSTAFKRKYGISPSELKHS
ncbi:MAG: AraC family transcriptional regulator [Bacteroidota bacterium]